MGRVWLGLGLLLAGAVAGFAGGEPDFCRIMADGYAGLATQGCAVAVMPDGTRFPASEWRHYAQGKFWGAQAARASVAATNCDPMVCILDFRAQCRSVDARLVLVPVPGKTVIYPELVHTGLVSDVRLDRVHEDFYGVLQDEGVVVQDLTPEFLGMKLSAVPVYARQDSHWSPDAVRRTAQLIGSWIKAQSWYATQPKKVYQRTNEVIRFTGDLCVATNGEAALVETARLERVSFDGLPVVSDPKSPVVLIGDSHVLVYGRSLTNGIAATGGGLFDQLAAEIGFAPDLEVADEGSPTGALLKLAFARANLPGVKCVIWCFAAPGLTENAEGWRRIPVVR